ncbi:MAG: multidrug DMT transporter permease, partial [Bacteroidales bacterium]|nr:multidrug DMT transporter permease [Bacteroidales bacterium]
IFSVILAFTLGSFGEQGRSFLPDLLQADSSALGSAFIGGIVFNLANIMVVLAIDIAGMAVAFPVGIGLALVIGVVVNYLASPDGNPVYLFVGLMLVTVAIIVDAFAYKQIPTEKSKEPKWKGLLLAILGGIFMGMFYRFVAASMSLDFVNPAAGMLTPYTALVFFALGIFASNFLWNTIIMYKPVTGSRATYREYFQKGTPRLHLIGMVGGLIWCLGMLFSILPANKASFAVSYGLGQGATMIAAAWGVFIWKEFRNSPNKTKTNFLLTVMFISFIAGLGLIILAKL